MDDSEHVDVEGKAGEPVTLPIAHGPATGYEWTLELPPGVERIGDGPERNADASQRLGAATGGRLQVRAARGDYVMVARLARPWQPDRPVRVVNIRLHVD
jgi:predicted secreted protein